MTFLKVRRKWWLLPIILVMLLVGMLLVLAQRTWGSPKGSRTESARGVPARLTVAEGRKFGLVVGGALLVLGAILTWRAHGTAASVVLVLGSALVVAGLALPTRLGPVHRGSPSPAVRAPAALPAAQ